MNTLDPYGELHRPQFHFTARENWINDPNGLVYQSGVWHLFFQHNIEAPVWGKMWWGHAVSDDLVHWRQVEHALYPDEMGTMFSGSAVIDHDNTAGFGAGAMLLFYTAASSQAEPKRPFSQCLAVSVDGGKEFTKFEGNPIVDWIAGDNRDPKVIWHAASQRWIMALYLTDDRYSFLSSPDAKAWTPIQDLVFEGERECPDFFPLTDESGQERWILTAAKGLYQIGSFDGEKFTAETPIRSSDQGRNSYAGQTWSNAPDGRCIQISWMAGGLYPEMPFNQQLSIPVELSLVGSGEDVSLSRWPVKELDALRKNTVSVERQKISNDEKLAPASDAQLFDVSFTVYKQQANLLYLVIRGHALIFDWAENKLTTKSSGFNKIVGDRSFVQLPDTPSLAVRLLVDKTSIEVFINGGQVSASFCFLPNGYINPVELMSFSGEQIIEGFEMHELESSWTSQSE
ncbi:MAG: glycoside hydrolase family 32 protein [Woeseiaceae bacterium]